MKISILTSIAALLASANAVIVYKTEHYHVTVTAGDGQVATIQADAPAPPPSSPAPPPPPPTTTSSPPPPPPSPTSSAPAQNNDVQQNAVDMKTVWVNAQGQLVSAGADSQQQSAPETSSPAPAPSPSSSPAPAPSPSSSSGSSGSSNLNSFASSCKDRHDSDRSNHKAPTVEWNQTLADYAKNYLENQNCVFAHSGGPYGENIAMGYDSPESAIAAWYKEGDQYNFGLGQFSESTGHFTQMVWKKSTQIGCAQVDCGSKGSFFACEYYPRGNIIGSFIENVLPGL